MSAPQTPVHARRDHLVIDELGTTADVRWVVTEDGRGLRLTPREAATRPP